MSKALTLRITDQMHESLRVQAFTERTTITALIIDALEARPKPSRLCDENRCWNPHTRIVSGGFHFCHLHGPHSAEPAHANRSGT